jgi:hypothetical protein
MIYRQRGSTLRVAIRRNAYHDEEYARIVLRQAGMADEEVEAFIRSCKN